MRINWTVRLKNKTWLLSMASTVLVFVYQVLGLFDIVPSISADELTQIVGLVLNILVGMGVVVDPTTTGMSDSYRAMSYTEPN